MTVLNLPVLLGTNRKDRKSVFVAEWLIAQMEARAEINARLFDVADFELPQRDYGQGLKDTFPEWRDAMINADGLVIISPEYNHGYPGSLKSGARLVTEGIYSQSGRIRGGVSRALGWDPRGRGDGANGEGIRPGGNVF